MKKHMGGMILCCLALLCLLPGCQDGKVIEESIGSESATSAASNSVASEFTQSASANQATEQVKEGELLTVEGFLDSGDIQKIYYGTEGTLLVQTVDTLYWYDVNSGSVLAQRLADNWLDVAFYPVENGFCAIAELSSNENTGGFTSSSSTLCVFYDEALQEVETITLNNLGDGSDYIKCAAISSDGNTIAYSTQDKLYCYDCTSSSLNMVLDLSYDLIESNNGLSGISSLVFSPSGDKLLYSGSTFSLPITEGQYSYITYGCIALDGSGFQNLPFQDYVAGSMAGAAGGYLFFEESMTFASGKLAVVDSSDMSQKVYSLGSVHEGEAGLFCSQGGEYYATEDVGKNQATIRLYRQDTGELICIQTIDDTNEEFFYRTPTLYILDSLNICIVKLGGFNNIPSKVVMFSL